METCLENWVGALWRGREGGLTEVVWGQCEAFKSVTKSGLESFLLG